MPLRDDWALASAEVERWLSELTDDEFAAVGGFIQWMLNHDGAPDDRVIVRLETDVDTHLRALLVPKSDELWAITFYVAASRGVILLTVYRLAGEDHPPEQMSRAQAAMDKARRAGDDPSVLVPGS